MGRGRMIEGGQLAVLYSSPPLNATLLAAMPTGLTRNVAPLYAMGFGPDFGDG